MLRELQDEPTGLEEVADAFEPQDELAVRGILIRLEQLGRDQAAIKARRDAVAAAYNDQLERIADQEGFLRRSLQAWLERGNDAKFPDVGTAYLQKGSPKVRVVDRDAFRAATGDVFVKETWDETWAKNYALALALESGEIMPGVELVPGGPELRVRKGAS
jgi:hypothetical protein